MSQDNNKASAHSPTDSHTCSPKRPLTRHFTTAFGVFQGGGVRGAGLAGAYAAARERGVHFTAVAGTSAGAIVAALIAAGATPDFLKERLSKQNFLDLAGDAMPGLGPSKPQLWRTIKSWLLPICTLGHVSWQQAKALRYAGMHSADPIQTWLEGMLRELTGKNDVVEFRDLRLPLFVVAGNASTRRAVVWSLADHPTMSVALAARRSASIPGFFQPSWDEQGLYVDGGPLSNLPAFVFAEPDRDGPLQSAAGRVLAFALEADRSEEALDTPAAYAKALVEMLVDGNVDLQLRMQSRIPLIRIPTGSIKATDFNISEAQRLALWEAGELAAHRFLDDEVQVAAARPARRYAGFEEEMYLFASIAADRPESITVVGRTEFVFNMMPILLHIETDGVTLRVLTRGTPAPPANAANDVQRGARIEQHRRTLLQGLGAEVRIVNDEAKLDSRIGGIPWDGFIARAGARSRQAIIVGAMSHDSSDDFRTRPVAVYKDPEDTRVIDALERDVMSLAEASTPWTPTNATTTEDRTTAASVRWEPCPSCEWEPLFRNVLQYAPNDVQLSVEDVLLKDVWAIDRFVKEYRIPGARRLIASYEQSGRPLFDPYWVKLANGRRSLVTPPVFEIGADQRVIAVEGVTRCFLLAERGERLVRGIVVRNVQVRLPGSPRRLAHVRSTSRTTTLRDNVGNEPGEFREIEPSVHPFP